MRKQVLALSDTAAARIRQLLQHQQKPFLRLAVEAKGCNGLSYVLNYARNFHFFPHIYFFFVDFFLINYVDIYLMLMMRREFILIREMYVIIKGTYSIRFRVKF